MIVTSEGKVHNFAKDMQGAERQKGNWSRASTPSFVFDLARPFGIKTRRPTHPSRQILASRSFQSVLTFLYWSRIGGFDASVPSHYAKKPTE